MHIEKADFGSRNARSEFVAQRFKPYLASGVLDVGCYEAPLRQILGKAHYTGIDFVGDPDVFLNLETCDALPYKDGDFACVMAIEVLEHLENLHSMFAQMARVSNRYIIMSLPNCWRDARRPIERGKGKIGHYGLPATRPDDRHKWFFSFNQAAEFAQAQAELHNLSVVEMFGTEMPKSTALHHLRKMRFPGKRYNNRYVQTLWSVFEKKPV